MIYPVLLLFQVSLQTLNARLNKELYDELIVLIRQKRLDPDVVAAHPKMNTIHDTMALDEYRTFNSEHLCRGYVYYSSFSSLNVSIILIIKTNVDSQ